ncbi:biotin/lipoyl-binding protein [Candidatus Acetothermia bacterium]|nr:biotin/lipoyl-binding protein [Candidatus Acetothermia bacterium]MBI3642784.1 biotin/lipoyl-binding protein [Candidatus Acetothermia bacterium]
MAGLTYIVDLGGRSLEVEVQHADGKLWAVIQGKKILVSLHRTGECGLYTVGIENRRRRVGLTQEDAHYKALWLGKEVPVSLEPASIHQLRRHLKSASAGKSGKEVIESHMPGLIVKINVKPGQPVRKGDGLLVIEAMKMENEIRAPQDGIIETMIVKEGQEVKGGQPLCVLRSTEESSNA